MKTKTQNILFIVWSYTIFWGMIFAAVGIMAAKPSLSSTVFPIVQVVGTWSPTLALFIMFKKLYPKTTLKEFYKKAFAERLNVKMLAVVTIAYALITLCVVGHSALTQGVSVRSLIDVSFMGFLVTLFSGATGEESGWRGHLQQATEKKHGVLLSCLIVGIIWAFWHTPTWINYIAAGFTHWIPFDILSKISLAFVIGICYNRCQNLLVPIWIHFVVNIFVNWTQGVLVDYFIWYVLLQLVIAIAYIIWHIKTDKPSRFVRRSQAIEDALDA